MTAAAEPITDDRGEEVPEVSQQDGAHAGPPPPYGQGGPPPYGQGGPPPYGQGGPPPYGQGGPPPYGQGGPPPYGTPVPISGSPKDVVEEPAWRPWLLAGAGVLVVGLFEQVGTGSLQARGSSTWLIVIGLAAAVALCRRRPGLALALIWLVGFVHAALGLGAMLVELVVVVIAFATSRWGSRTVLWLSGLSIPIGALIATLVLSRIGPSFATSYLDLVPAVEATLRLGLLAQVFFGVVPLLVLAVPWLLGLALRAGDRAQESRGRQLQAEGEQARAEVERARAELDRATAESQRAQAEDARWQAQEIADLRADQARLAHDVHDVVGHSLAVILAQAESAQFLPEGDTDRIRQTMTNIATSARQSLRDVRDVLATGTPAAGGAVTDGLDSLVDGVRAAGHDLRSTVVGTPQPLPPELNTVAYRVLQEMLTNALKHGRRGQPVLVERHWEGELRIEVRNVAGEPRGAAAGRVAGVTAGERAGERAGEMAGEMAGAAGDAAGAAPRGTDADAPYSVGSNEVTQVVPTGAAPSGSASTEAVLLSTPALSTPAQSTPALSTPALSTPALSTPALSTPNAGRRGLGLEGMRTRLDSVGGRLDVRRRDERDGPTFTVTAWVPLRPVPPGDL